MPGDLESRFESARLGTPIAAAAAPDTAADTAIGTAVDTLVGTAASVGTALAWDTWKAEDSFN